MVEHHRGLRRLAATTAVGALAGVSLVLAPPVATGAEDGTCSETHLAVTGGTFDWGVRESWRNYLSGSFVGGGWNLDDVSYNGSAFVFTPDTGRGGLDTDGTGVIPFRGSINFHGHKGALDMTFSDIALVIDGGTAGIRVDYRTYETDYATVGDKGREVTGDDVVIAEIDLDRPVDPDANTLSLAGSTTLTSGGLKLFEQYRDNPAMDRAGGALQLETECGPVPGGSGSGGGSRGGGGKATTGMGGLIAGLNDTFSEINTLMGNTTDLFDNSEALHDRVWAEGDSQAGGNSTGTNTGTTTSGPVSTAGGAGTGTTTGGAGATGTTTTSTGGGDVARTGASGGGAGAGTGIAAAPASTATGTGGGDAGSGSGDVCTADSSRGVTQAEAQWGVRKSFLNYISGGIAKGGWELSGVGYENGTFRFSGDSGAVDPQAESGTILFPGTLRFTGHGGVLDTRFSNLEIQFSGNSGALVVNASSNSTEGEANDYGRVTLATLNFSSLQVSDTEVSGTAETSLTEAGSRAFGDFYPAGDSLDPISFRASLGGGASCAEGQGGTANSAAAGGGNADRAAELRGGGSSTGGGDGISADGSVFDEVTGDGETMTSDSLAAAEDGNQFRIRSAGAENDPNSDRLVTLVLLIVAAFVVAGASLSNFGRRNPTVG